MKTAAIVKHSDQVQNGKCHHFLNFVRAAELHLQLLGVLLE